MIALSGSDTDKTIFQFMSHALDLLWRKQMELHRKMYLANRQDKPYAPLSFPACSSTEYSGDNTADENVFCFVQMSRIFLAFSCRLAEIG